MAADAFLVESKQTPLHLFLTILDSSVTYPQQSSLCSLAAFNLQLQFEFTKCQLNKKCQQLPTFPLKSSIIGVRELDFRVRNGNGYFLSTMATSN